MRAAAARMSTSYERCLCAIAMLAVLLPVQSAAGAGSALSPTIRASISTADYGCCIVLRPPVSSLSQAFLNRSVRSGGSSPRAAFSAHTGVSHAGG